MSAILELDDESASQRTGVVSESGYTTAEEEASIVFSIDGAASLTRLDSPMLGARKRYVRSSMPLNVEACPGLLSIACCLV
jgi:hypothetical protein